MKIKNKISISIFVIAFSVLTISSFFFVINGYKEILSTSVNYILDDVNDHATEVKVFINNKFIVANILANTPIIIESLLTSNAEYSVLSKAQIKNKINELNNRWEATTYASDPFIQSYLNNKVAKFLRSQALLIPNEYGEIYLTNQYGVLVASTNRLPTLYHGQKYLWKAAYEFGNIVDETEYDENVGAKVLGISAPVIFEGRTIGILKSNVLMETLLKGLPFLYEQEQVKISDQNLTFLLRVNGEIISSHDDLIDKKVLDAVSSKMQKGISGTEIILNRGKRSLVAYTPVKIPFAFDNKRTEAGSGPMDQKGGNIGYGWYIFSIADINSLMTPLYDTLQKFIFIGFFLIIVMSMSAYVISNKISEPIKKLVLSSKNVGKGDYSSKIDTISNDEFDELSASFNQMIENLNKSTISVDKLNIEVAKHKQTEKIVQEKESFIQFIINNIPIGIAVNSIDPEINFSYMNDNFAKFYRTTKAELNSKDGFWNTVYEDPHFRDKIKKRILDDCASGDINRMHWENIPITRTGKGTTFISARNTPISNSNMVISTVWDVTEQLKYEESLLNKEAQISGVTNSFPGVIYQFYARPNNEYGVSYFSKQAEVIFGFDIEKIALPDIFPYFLEHVAPECRKEFILSLQTAVNNISNWKYEGKYIKPDGSIIDFEGSSQPFRNQNEIIFNGVLLDITSRKKAEEQLVLLNNLLDYSSDSIFIIDPSDSRILNVNKQASLALGYTHEELINMRVIDLEAKIPDSHLWKEHMAEVRRTGSLLIEGRHKRKDGTIFPVEISIKLITRANNEYMLSIARDITKRKRAEHEIKILSLLPDEDPDPIMRMTKEGKILYSNKSSNTLLDFCGRRLQDYMNDAWRSAIRESYEKNEKGTIEINACNIILEFVITPVVEMGYVNVYGRNITELKNSLKEVSEAKRNWDEIFNTINDAITIHDMDYNILFANHAAQELLGKSAAEILNSKCYASYHQKDSVPEKCPSCQTLKTGKITVNELFEPLFNKFVEIKAIPRFDENKNIIGTIHIIRDLTERHKAEALNKQLQGQIFQSKKLDAVGTMASGIAHNFNNILGAIRGSVEMAFDDIPQNSRTRKDLERVIFCVESAKQLTDQMMSYSKTVTRSKLTTNIVSLIKGAINMFSASTKGLLRIQENLDPDCGELPVDPNELQHVLLNLFRNSYQSLDPDTGFIEVGAQRVIVDQALTLKHITLKEGEHIKIYVKDNGKGINKEDIEHIFEPFFTTKEIGKGTGLGLSMVHGIITGYGGVIYVESEVNEGTTFTILLPRV